MSVSDIPTRKLYDCDGAAKNYPILYQYLAESDNTVKHIDSVGDITLLILDDVGANGFVITAGEVVTNTLYPDTDQIWLIRETPRTQASVRKNNRRTPASVDDGSYDKLTMIVQEMEDTQERTLALADTTPTDVSVEIPAPVARRSAIWDATGKFLEYTTYDPDTQQSGAAASAAAALVSEDNAADSETAAGVSETNAGDSEVAAAASAASLDAETGSIAADGDFTAGTIRWYKIGKLVTITIESSAWLAAGLAGSSAGIIPAAFRPSEVASSVGMPTGSRLGRVTVSATGQLYVYLYDWDGTPVAAATGLGMLGTVSFVTA